MPNPVITETISVIQPELGNCISNHGQRANILTKFQRQYLEICSRWEQKTCDIRSSLCPCTGGSTSSEISKKVWVKFSGAVQVVPQQVSNNANTKQSRSTVIKLRIRDLTDRNHEGRPMPLPETTVPQDYFDHDDGNQQTIFLKNSECHSSFNHRFLLKFLQHTFSITMWLVRTLSMLTVLFVLSYAIFVLHKPTESFVLRNTQDSIYPFMRRLRLMSLPFLDHSYASSLTKFYDDPCLLHNSYFTVDSVECWSCESIRQVIDFGHTSNLSIEFSDSGIPFVVKDSFPSTFDIESIFAIYSQNEEHLAKEILSSSYDEIDSFSRLRANPEILMRNDFHLMWKINRVTVARILRRHLPKPFFIPPITEVSIQHYVFIDHWKGRGYSLPLTEFTNVFALQLSEERYFVLIPTFDCQAKCHMVSIVLRPRDICKYGVWSIKLEMSEPFNTLYDLNSVLQLVVLAAYLSPCAYGTIQLYCLKET